MNFTVEVELYHGPLDLLLYLIRRQELQVSELPLAKISQQYMDFIDVLEMLDIDSVGDFLEIAALLVEMKAKAVLPQIEDEAEVQTQLFDQTDDSLVQRLIEFKRYRDAASVLDERSAASQMRYRRLANDLPSRTTQPHDQPIESIELWDLVSAFGRILRERQPAPTETVIYDETPMHVYMQKIHDLVRQHKEIELQSLFEIGQHKSTLVGLFLATLELTRHHGVHVSQVVADGPLMLSAGEDIAEQLQVSVVDNMLADQLEKSNFAYRPR